jgi:hypothetical protein
MPPLQTVKVCGASDYVVTADSEPMGGRYLNVRVEATGAAFEAEIHFALVVRGEAAKFVNQSSNRVTIE